MSDETTPTDGSPTFLLLVPAGLSLGIGIVLLYYSFGWEDGWLNQNLAGAGFTGLDNIGPLSAIDFSLGFIVLGLITMVFLNANAWKYTDGY